MVTYVEFTGARELLQDEVLQETRLRLGGGVSASHPVKKFFPRGVGNDELVHPIDSV